MENKIFSKVKNKNLEQRLEIVLENKYFSEEVQNLLLSMFYKLEANYTDFLKVKRKAMDKNIFLEKIILDIERYCNKVEIIKYDEKEKLKVNLKSGEITTFLSESVVLKQLELLTNRGFLVLDKYEKKEIENYMRKISAISTQEIIRNYTGYSWTSKNIEKDDSNYFTIYQILIYLFDIEFIDKWKIATEINSDEDFIENLKMISMKEYRNIDILNIFMQIILQEEIINSSMQKEKYIEKIKKDELELKKLEDRDKYFENLSSNRTKYRKELKKLDSILNSKEELEKEVEELNNVDAKIFITAKNLKSKLIKEREKIFTNLKETNELLIPKNFVNKKNKIENEINNYKRILNIEKNELLVDFVKESTKALRNKFEKITNKKEIKEYIYMLRYYRKLPIYYNDELITIYDITEVKKEIKVLEEIIIKKAYSEKLINPYSNDLKTNIEITRKIFALDAMSFENIYFKFILKEEVLQIRIYEGEILEGKTTIDSKVENYLAIRKLGKKKNKSFRVFY